MPFFSQPPSFSWKFRSKKESKKERKNSNQKKTEGNWQNKTGKYYFSEIIILSCLHESCAAEEGWRRAFLCNASTPNHLEHACPNIHLLNLYRNTKSQMFCCFSLFNFFFCETKRQETIFKIQIKHPLNIEKLEILGVSILMNENKCSITNFVFQFIKKTK